MHHYWRVIQVYTGGTVKEFEAVLELADDSPNITADLLAAIADDILSRSPGTAYNLESLVERCTIIGGSFKRK